MKLLCLNSQIYIEFEFENSRVLADVQKFSMKMQRTLHESKCFCTVDHGDTCYIAS